MRNFAIFLFIAIGIFLIDQGIKEIFIEGYFLEGECIDLVLHYNLGVAFSMFAFLGAYLKWIQIVLVFGILFFTLKEGYLIRYPFPIGLLIGGAIGNLYDRFVHQGVVDYVAWHCGFDFAVFNLADVAIDFAVVWLLFMIYYFDKKEKYEV